MNLYFFSTAADEAFVKSLFEYAHVVIEKNEKMTELAMARLLAASLFSPNTEEDLNNMGTMIHLVRMALVFYKTVA